MNNGTDIQRLRSYLPLCDSINATFSLSHSEHAVDWRFHYVVAITTLRAVGHVLHKVDCENYPEIKEIVSNKYDRWRLAKNNDALFVHFICEARNVLLKTYSFLSDDQVVFSEDEDGMIIGEGPNIDRVIGGYFDGEDVVGLLQHSHKWWQVELKDIATHVNGPATNELRTNNV